MNGNKYDSGKPKVGLMIKDFADALNEVAKVSTFGCIKYGTPSGWQMVEDAIQRYSDAKCRHMLQAGVDEESGLLHLAHEAWNVLAILQLTIEKKNREAENLEKKNGFKLADRVIADES